MSICDEVIPVRPDEAERIVRMFAFTDLLYDYQGDRETFYEYVRDEVEAGVWDGEWTRTYQVTDAEAEYWYAYFMEAGGPPGLRDNPWYSIGVLYDKQTIKRWLRTEHEAWLPLVKAAVLRAEAEGVKSI